MNTETFNSISSKMYQAFNLSHAKISSTFILHKNKNNIENAMVDGVFSAQFSKIRTRRRVGLLLLV